MCVRDSKILLLPAVRNVNLNVSINVVNFRYVNVNFNFDVVFLKELVPLSDFPFLRLIENHPLLINFGLSCA